MKTRRFFEMLAGLVAWSFGLLVSGAEPSRKPIEFARDIRPLLAKHCYACHGPDREGQDTDLRLDSRDAALAHAIVPGDSASSPLIARVSSEDAEQRMPPTDSKLPPLSSEQIALLQRWIDAGADFTTHWAYRPTQRANLPSVHESTWINNEIDTFVLAANEQRGVAQAADTNPQTLVRRLSIDLLGLPPYGEGARTYLSHPTEANYSDLVEELLDSEHFGERMAVLWLDLVRFADTCGYHGDQHRDLDAYRDYIITAFNENKPFDVFTLEQLAGDLLPERNTETLIASGYNRLLQTTEEGGAQAKEYRAIYDADRVRNVSTVWLGSTLGCAQCHDHKFDPFTTRDFYRLAAVFGDISEVEVGRQPPNLELPTEEQKRNLDHVTQQIEERKKQIAANSEGSAELQTELKEIEQRRQSLQAAIRRTLVTSSVERRMTRVLPRGNWLDESGEIVTPAIPAVFQPTTGDPVKCDSRLDFARWLIARDNPLTARVFVNHLWRVMFGLGLVRTPEDFGAQGQYPTHPELLDWLAVEFQESGWNVKHMLRLMAMSHTYRQSSKGDASSREHDPYNLWLNRQHRFRLDAEFVRDNALSVSGLLDERVAGKSVKPYQPDGYWAQLNFPKRTYEADSGNDQYRRGVYTYWCRTFLHPSLVAFDAPSREECTARRTRSNTPLQALVLLNDPTYVEAARSLADHVMAVNGHDARRIEWAYDRVLSRAPSEREKEVLIGVLNEQRDRYGVSPGDARALLTIGQMPPFSGSDQESIEAAAWMSAMRVLLNLHETITRF